ncbi:MAG: hypothetical protein U1F98_17545 [Verrucomicrobiota bacterium]
MKLKSCLAGRLGSAVLGILFLCSGLAAQAGDTKFEALLVWATNAETSPDPNQKPVDAEVRKKLGELPLKWAHYFEVNRKHFGISKDERKEVTLSDECKIAVKHVEGKDFEVSLIGKGKPVLKRVQALPRGEMLVLGGPAPDSTGWLVVLKRIE